jgi:hypothetical protein
LRAVVHRAFFTYNLHRIEANIQPRNRASRGLVQSIGFTQEGFSQRYLKILGRWRDHERWAITREAWAKADKPKADKPKADKPKAAKTKTAPSPKRRTASAKRPARRPTPP